MAIGIIAAMDEEIHCLKEKIKIKKHEKIAGFNIYTGTLEQKDVVLSQSGVGKVNVAICTTLLIQSFDCHVIINTGAAAGLIPDMKAGDIVIADTVSYHDVDATAFGYEMGQVPRMPLIYNADPKLLDILKKFPVDKFKYNIYTGLIISGDVFVDNAAPIKAKFPQACALEMESAAVAQTCYRFNVPFVIARSISDKGEEDAGIAFDKFVKIAGENSGIMAEFLVDQL